ncbi:hypothetical protein LCGC14_0337930 [marine sediment metagenome]|uniref:Uncharacterized protein n=1 Tax=marine sediment metagenome TaxID=412755 RepID=A0A0F9TJX7_9ZZZZ
MGTQFLKPRQIRDNEEERDRLKVIMDQPDPDGKFNKGEVGAQLHRINKFLEEGTPPPTTLERRDELNREIATLEAEISDNMPFREDMVRSTPGTGDHHRKWEKANKSKILRWKDAKRELDPTNDDVDFTNVEILRRQNDLGKIVPFRQYSGVDMRGGDIVPGGIPDAEKIEARIAPPEVAVAVLEQEEPTEAQSFTVACDDCHFTRTKDTKKKADSALRMHRLKKHK